MAEKTDEPDILKCGLCSKRLNVPKTVPCLHMFCETCLWIFIYSEVHRFTSSGPRIINCPVCKSGFPVSRNLDISTFISNFPTNDHIEGIIKREKLLSNGTICGPCQRRKQTKKTNIWCIECEEGMCDDCCEVHSTIKAAVSHETVDVTQVKTESFPIYVNIFCSTHNDKKLTHFCSSHKEPCCHECVSTIHRICNRVILLKDAARKDKKINGTSNLIQRLEEGLETLNNDIEERDYFFQTIKADMREVKCKIASFRIEINNRLDDLETTLQKEFEVLHDKKIAELTTKTEEFKNTHKIIGNCKRLLQILIEKGSDISLFLEKKQIAHKLKEQEAVISKLESEPPFKFRYKASFSPELVNLTTSLQSLGINQCAKVTPVQVQVGKFLDIPGKSTTTKTRDDQLREIMRFTSSKGGPDIIGVELISDGSMLLTRYENKSLYLFDNKGKLQKELQLPRKPCDVTMTNEDEAVVTYNNIEQTLLFSIFGSNADGVCIVDINKMNITHENIIQGSYYGVHGVTVHLDKLIIACSDRIIILDMEGSLINKIKTPAPNNSTRYIMAISNEVLYYSNREERSVVCIDIKGTIIFKYTHGDFNGIRGITADSVGIIYVGARLLYSPRL